MIENPIPLRNLKHWLIIVGVVIWASAGAVELRADQTIVVRSGNGPIGSQDAQVRFLAYGTTGDITPSAANFISVKTAPFAYIVAPYATYVAQLPDDPLAKWIATNPGLVPDRHSMRFRFK